MLLRGDDAAALASQRLGIRLDATSEASVQEQLRKALAASGTRVVDVFRAIDGDSEGTISRDEFRRALPLLGFDVPGVAAGLALISTEW